MGIVRKIVSVIAGLALAVAFVGAGFVVCATPPVTSALSNMFSDDALSPFSRSQLVTVAEATRDYSFGAHDKAALYEAIYKVDLQLRQEIVNANGTIPFAFPRLDVVTDRGSVEQYETAFRGASELYCYSADTISHLDDCHDIASRAYPLVIAFAAIGALGLVLVGVTGGKRKVGAVLLVSGVVVLVSFIALGAWAAIDFAGFFAAFHGILFAQGNWTFPYDSLLICALPAPFWAGMGVVWLAVSLLASVLAVVVGKRLR